MLIEHLTQSEIEDYCRQQLRPAELLSVADHMGACESCRRRVEAAINGDASFFTLRSEVFGEAAEISSAGFSRFHATAEQAAGYVEGSLSGAELQTVGDHLTRCEQCAVAINDLRSFRNQIEPSLDREYHPANVNASTESWWHRAAAALIAVFPKSPGLAFGTAMSVLLLAVTGWFVWQSLQQRQPKEERAVSPSPVPSQPAPEASVSQVVAQLDDGDGRLTLDQQGKLSGVDLPPAYQSMLKDALANGRIARSPQLKGLTRAPSSLMSADKEADEFSVIEPVGRVLMTDRPVFRWSPLEGATGYVVEVYDVNFNLVATSPQLSGVSWAVPKSLARGSVYAWQVKAMKNGQEVTSPRPPAPQARFRVLDQANANELAKAKQAYPSSHLTLGLLYAEAGLLKEAEQELRLLQKANPDSELVRRLLGQIQTLRR